MPNLRELDRLTWFKILARFNNLLRTNKDIKLWDVLGIWFQGNNNQYANELYQKILSAYIPHDEPELTTLNLWTNLKLLDEIISTESGTSSNEDTASVERKLFNAYLIINEEFGNKSDQITKNLPLQDDILSWLAKTTVALLLPYNDFANVEPVDLWISQFIKARYCFNF